MAVLEISFPFPFKNWSVCLAPGGELGLVKSEVVRLGLSLGWLDNLFGEACFADMHMLDLDGWSLRLDNHCSDETIRWSENYEN